MDTEVRKVERRSRDMGRAGKEKPTVRSVPFLFFFSSFQISFATRLTSSPGIRLSR